MEILVVLCGCLGLVAAVLGFATLVCADGREKLWCLALWGGAALLWLTPIDYAWAETRFEECEVVRRSPRRQTVWIERNGQMKELWIPLPRWESTKDGDTIQVSYWVGAVFGGARGFEVID